LSYSISMNFNPNSSLKKSSNNQTCSPFQTLLPKYFFFKIFEFRKTTFRWAHALASTFHCTRGPTCHSLLLSSRIASPTCQHLGPCWRLYLAIRAGPKHNGISPARARPDMKDSGSCWPEPHTRPCPGLTSGPPCQARHGPFG
jgi:hypothetical protein